MDAGVRHLSTRLACGPAHVVSPLATHNVFILANAVVTLKILHYPVEV